MSEDEESDMEKIDTRRNRERRVREREIEGGGGAREKGREKGVRKKERVREGFLFVFFCDV